MADNLTTALVMGAVAVAVGQGRPRFVALACINVVVAANAGGAFSPFGDITTLLVWQAGHVPFAGFFALFVPSLVNWLIPAALMTSAVEAGRPAPRRARRAGGRGGPVAPLPAHDRPDRGLPQALHLPPALGMMSGLGVLKMYSYVFNRRSRGRRSSGIDETDDVFAAPQLGADAATATTAAAGGTGRGSPAAGDGARVEAGGAGPACPARRGDTAHLRRLERVEWDTLMFFFGVILGVGGLGVLGYLALRRGPSTSAWARRWRTCWSGCCRR